MRRPHYDVGRHETAAMDADTNKGAWSKQEDEKLVSYIRKHGEGCWRTLPQAAGLLRCGKSCRLRWVNYLKPGLKRGNFSDDEEDLIVKLHALLGNRWSLIAGRLPGRTDNQVKNYWNTHLRRKLVQVGIDPNNHRLNQTLARPPTRSEPPPKSETTHAGDSRLLRIRPIPSKSSMRDEACSNADQVSDSGSCLLEDSATNRQLPDLNLDINLGTTSLVKTDHQGICNHPSMVFETPTSNSPTLLLFA